VVDDEALIRWSLVETLSDSGHEVVAAKDGAEAVQAIRTAATLFDVALLDFRLPDSNDLALLSRLRHLASTMRIILMTAYSAPDVTQGALSLGAYCVLNKPFEMRALADLVTQAHAASRP
jgi:DNA-binding NtrC family response regulator